ncbi:spermidine/putrescine transport system ATP-binding protein [Angulomicrobium tetraedrale]|uniref:Spermidine/putrescine transport system ATP-binding protein n=1 Tax=Ancylobacter tetraedralis TaxID=217068 RepID=A0A839ZBR1_9HYPH|nr:ABC transporter ATP-binding protein [Ancylobacter tetraedralis]MBB3772179.1 spermidine/putrescine transport system ATP-binding protein [Ancylobacter tetraedralis]
MSRDVSLDRVTMRFASYVAVNNVSLDIKAGEFFSFLGPSGCGKTTILRMISGFMNPTEGRILIGGEDMKGNGPNKRPTALIFQNLALFPMMSVADNIAFGLEMRGVDKAVRRRRAEELLELVALPDAADKRVDELSGGMKQRVAIARALAVEPQVMLLDEPLSALDLKLRQHMRAELRAIQRRTGLTFIYITHDQGEALTMSDRVGVMSRGQLEQVGPPSEIYNEPATAFVAGFVGENNVFTGRITEVAGGQAVVETGAGRFVGRNPRGIRVGTQVVMLVRPERLKPLTVAGPTPENPNVLSRSVDHIDFEGAFANVHLKQPDGAKPLSMHISNDGSLTDLVGDRIFTVGFAPQDALVLAANGA